jgi:hypothetical protein
VTFLVTFEQGRHIIMTRAGSSGTQQPGQSASLRNGQVAQVRTQIEAAIDSSIYAD